MTSISRSYIQMISDYQQRNIGNIISPATYLNANGKIWSPRVINTRSSGTPKRCFQNAYELVCDNADLRYVEGFATRIIPTSHAWCVNEANEVIDPTWPFGDKFDTPDYFGMEISIGKVLRIMMLTEEYGIFNDSMKKWEKILKIL